MQAVGLKTITARHLGEGRLSVGTYRFRIWRRHFFRYRWNTQRSGQYLLCCLQYEVLRLFYN